MSTPKRRSRDALVLSGGGALGAFEVGVLKALMQGRSPSTDYQPLTAEIFTGTSVGAYNAAFLVSQGAAPAHRAVELLEHIWRVRLAGTPADCGNGVYRLRTAPVTFDPGCFLRPAELLSESLADAAFWSHYAAERGVAFAVSPETLPVRVAQTFNFSSLFAVQRLYDLITSTIDPAALAASDKELTIAATNFQAGVVQLFSKRDLVDGVGTRGIEASTAVPGIFPEVDIDGVPFVDGGVLLNTPIKPAILAGARVLHVIFLDPGVANIPRPELPNTLDTIYRTLMIMLSNNFNGDIEVARNIVKELRTLVDRGLLARDYSTILGGEEEAEKNPILRRIKRGQRPFRPLVIHKYRPRVALGGAVSLLDFRSTFINELIEKGYQNGLTHNCAQEGCILAEGFEMSEDEDG